MIAQNRYSFSLLFHPSTWFILAGCWLINVCCSIMCMYVYTHTHTHTHTHKIYTHPENRLQSECDSFLLAHNLPPQGGALAVSEVSHSEVFLPFSSAVPMTTWDPFWFLLQCSRGRWWLLEVMSGHRQSCWPLNGPPPAHPPHPNLLGDTEPMQGLPPRTDFDQ